METEVYMSYIQSLHMNGRREQGRTDDANDNEGFLPLESHQPPPSKSQLVGV